IVHREVQSFCHLSNTLKKLGKNLKEPFCSQYPCGSLLGSGGFGSVFLGQRLSDGRQVAIKQVTSDRVQQWARLPAAFKGLGSRHVVCMLDWFKVEGRGYLLVLERPQCQDLFDFTSQRHITEEGGAKVIAEVLIM
uniref:non-specific serine/threonine protein kinase n=1 Tax=Labrus bergylta TaxID=56723 RepID=A0A3Q3F2S8_9LABR